MREVSINAALYFYEGLPAHDTKAKRKHRKMIARLRNTYRKNPRTHPNCKWTIRRLRESP